MFDCLKLLLIMPLGVGHSWMNRSSAEQSWELNQDLGLSLAYNSMIYIFAEVNL